MSTNDKNEFEAGSEKLARGLRVAADEAAEGVRDAGARALEGGMAALAAATQRVEGHASELRGAAQHYVRSYPWQVIGAAAAAGLVAGWLMSRR
ncbi:glycine zipper domain-containing protein [Ramlibacter sp.]|uniref:glycine zipper domain-containing protein n=1 Tax=Ramlibacter sp. TaxID=1917967 RepID=UPI003D0B299A